MKAKYIFHVEGTKLAIEVFYKRLTAEVPEMRQWEVRKTFKNGKKSSWYRAKIKKCELVMEK